MPGFNKIKLVPPIINPYREGQNESFIPLGLLALAASLKENGFHTTIYKSKTRIVKSTDYLVVAKDILADHPEIVGFSTWCITYPSSLLLAQHLKLLSPALKIVFGGPQASVLPEITLRNFPQVDYVLAGEADFSLPLFIKELNKKQPGLNHVPGLTYRNESGKIYSSPVKEFIDSLDKLPVPAYSMVKEMTSFKIDAGRGCPFHCTFCTTSNFFSKKYRLKSTDRILYEMKTSYFSSKINKFNFAHDLFTLNRKFIDELCEKLIQLKLSEKISFKWTCSARIDCTDANMLIKMKKAGCESVFFGIESGSKKIQKSIGKNLKIKKASQVAETCRQSNLNMHASFIAGFPDETKKDLEKTLRCALKLALKGALVQISELSLLPGTPIYNRYHTNLKLDGFFSNFSNNFCSPAEIKLIRQFPEIFSSFYYLPVNTLSHNEMHYLCRIINTSSYFRNTIYLLKEIIKQDLNEKSLLQLFRNVYDNWERNQELYHPAVSLSVNLLRNYILKNKSRIKYKELFDVFSFEAYQALLTTKYNHWQLVKDRINAAHRNDKPTIKPIPSWTVLKTSYNLNRTLPEEHNWNSLNLRKRKGSFIYLLVVDSAIKCRRVKISSTDEFLLNSLSDITIETFIKATGVKVMEKDAIRWLKKMQKMGVLEVVSSH